MTATLVEFEEEFATYPDGGARIPGIGPALPPGELLLWVGSPDARRIARQVLHVRFLVGYFTVLLLGPALFAAPGARVAAVLHAAVWLVPLAVTTVVFARTFASLVARTTVYAITDRRVVMKVGIALPTTINIPLATIASAAMRPGRDGGGDISVALTGDVRVAYLLLWPHARPWRLAKPEPTLRGIDDVASVGRLLKDALATAGNP